MQTVILNAFIRAVRTFFQAAIPVYIAGIAGATDFAGLGSTTLLQAASIAGVIAAYCHAWDTMQFMVQTLTRLFEPPPRLLRRYSNILTVAANHKGVLDVDTVKGCTEGTKAYPDGCYGECYAKRIADRYGFDFTTSVSRRWLGPWHMSTLRLLAVKHPSNWYRVGTHGDPSHDWEHTVAVMGQMHGCGKTPVVITKHWGVLTDQQINLCRKYGAVFNTSVSGLDTDVETTHRVSQMERLQDGGVKSVARVVSVHYGTTEWAQECSERQEYLMSLPFQIIDNPLRVSRDNPRLARGDIVARSIKGAVGGGTLVSVDPKSDTFLGHCEECPDQCGVAADDLVPAVADGQTSLWESTVVFEHVKAVTGSGYEEAVAALAIEDGIAHRAARKNMQKHSAIILTINDTFAGFFTTAIITTDPRSKFETPQVFESVGFETYLKMSGFHYMVKGEPATVRMKLLAHMTMVNVWKTTGGDWLRLKKEWKAKLEAEGEKHGIPNPGYASRDGCWQGTNGFANVVTGRAHNGNASVLDPVACEVILRFFMPTDGHRVYNPFGGGVQFGFVTGSYGYEYVASEIRQNQCDANNQLCSCYESVKWVQSDSATYHPEGMFDLVFSCPPYYKVETYLDYDGKPPAGEINSLPTYEEFRETLFAGYRIAIEHLNDGCFFAIMTGDSRDNKGAYYCSEAETELFLKGAGLSVYNRIVYVEGAFTRLAQAKVTLNTRKFPKCEQKIIVAYKGDMSKISERFAPVGRL
ncbi:MAG: hypothetical protein LC667_02490 [Thioalkalivibrio sp.]|nr:hypothetical protein [Thioalkalivibrio sp.]